MNWQAFWHGNYFQRTCSVLQLVLREAANCSQIIHVSHVLCMIQYTSSSTDCCFVIHLLTINWVKPPGRKRSNTASLSPWTYELWKDYHYPVQDSSMEIWLHILLQHIYLTFNNSIQVPVSSLKPIISLVMIVVMLCMTMALKLSISPRHFFETSSRLHIHIIIKCLANQHGQSCFTATCGLQQHVLTPCNVFQQKAVYNLTLSFL